MSAVKSLSSMSPRRSKKQKKCRRKTTLMKKAFEYISKSFCCSSAASNLYSDNFD